MQFEFDALRSHLRALDFGLAQSRSHAVGAIRRLKDEVDFIDRSRRILRDARTSLPRAVPREIIQRGNDPLRRRGP